jgi:hypothetical protein
MAIKGPAASLLGPPGSRRASFRENLMKWPFEKVGSNIFSVGPQNNIGCSWILHTFGNPLAQFSSKSVGSMLKISHNKNRISLLMRCPI